TCAVSASFSPEQAPRESVATSAAARKRMRDIELGADGRGQTVLIPSGGYDCSQGADQAFQHWRSAQPRELEGKRLYAPYVDLELHFLEGRRERLHARHRIIPKGNTGFVSAHHDSLYAQCGAEQAKLGDVEERLGSRRERAEPVADLEAHVLDRRGFGDRGQAPVHVELGVLARDVVVRKERRDVERDV